MPKVKCFIYAVKKRELGEERSQFVVFCNHRDKAYYCTADSVELSNNGCRSFDASHFGEEVACA